MIIAIIARNKVCSFSKNGAIEDQSKVEKSTNKENDFSLKYRFLPTTTTTTVTTNHQEPLRNMSNQLDKLSKLYPGEGKEGRWFLDINLLSNGVTQKNPKDTFPLDLNTNLINLYFRYRHTVFPIFSKSIFYRLLEQRDPFITPLLLNSIYCHAAHFSHGDAIHANTYYRKAEQILLQEELLQNNSTPSLSVITSLCLLATFESNHFGTGPHVNPQKAFTYLDIACRMCYDLKLHKRYAFHHSGTTPDEIELRKRVYWVCYCYDKLQFLMTGKPYLLSSTIDIDLPILVLDSEDPNEYEINACFIEHIKLMQLCESIPSEPLEQNSTGFILEEQLMYWQSNLPPSLQHWTTTTNQMNPLASHLHLVYNYVQLLSSSNQQRKRASIATTLTQLVGSMAEQPYCILSFQLGAEVLMASVRVHLLDCGDENLLTARHARSMYQRSIRILKTLLHHRYIEVESFVHVLNEAFASQENTSNSSSSPIHALSPVIPKHQKFGMVSSTPTTSSLELIYDHAYDNNIPQNWTKPQVEKKEEKELMLFTPRYGLGVYASAHQHHTDVLRQHMPNIKTNHSNRPVLLNHFGQVVVQQQQQQ